MSSTSVTFSGFVYDADGVAVQSATINIYAKNTVTPSLGSTTSDATGSFSISSTNASVTSSGGDLAISHPTSGAIARRKWADEVMYKTLNLESLVTGSINSTGGGALLGTWSDLGIVTTVDINGGSIDGVTIGAAAAPTVTNLGAVATCDINGGTLSGVTVDGSLTWSAAQNFGAYTVYVNDTASTFMTIGLHMDQGANTDNILIFESTGLVAHGMTDNWETATFAAFLKSENSGGLQIRGMKSDAGNAGHALMFTGYLGEAVDTTKSAAGIGIQTFDGYVKSGTSLAAPGADANILVIRSGGQGRFIFDAEGEMHSDAVIGVGDDWDDYDDLAMASAISRLPKAKFNEMMQYSAEDFERAGLLTLSVDEQGQRHAFIRHKAMLQFAMCCFREVHQRFLEKDAEVTELANRLAITENKLAALPA